MTTVGCALPLPVTSCVIRAMGLPITSLYCGFLATFYMMITMRVISLRTQLSLLFGDGGNSCMTRAIRVRLYGRILPVYY